MNPNRAVQLGVNLLNAIQALRLKSHRLVGTDQGVEIIQPGKPVLLLTHRAVEDFAAETGGAE